MKVFDPCIQVRLLNWQCNRALHLLEKFGIYAVMRGLLWFTSLSSILAALGSIAVMNWLFRYVSSRDPDMAVWVMLVCLLSGMVASWAWSSAWGLGVLHHKTREDWCLVQKNPLSPEAFLVPRRVWQFRLLGILLDPASMSMLRQRGLEKSTVASTPGESPPSPARF